MDINHLTLLTDLYELTMMQGYFKTGNDETVVFDVFYRDNPSGSGYAITCGLDQVIDYIKNLSFSYDDIDYLRNQGIFDEDFLEYLAGYHFTGDIYAIPEGTVVFPREPLLKVKAPIMEAQLVETAILNIINQACRNCNLKYHQSSESDRYEGFSCCLCCWRKWCYGIRTSPCTRT